jgi:hypothetical protein
MKISILQRNDIGYLNKLLMENGRLKVLDASVYEEIPNDHLRQFCVRKGIYQLPTTELVQWVREMISGRKAIEIGAGNGAFAKELGIIATDSHQQERPEIKALYKLMGQQTVKYGKNVKKFDAKRAIKKYKPKVVVANWVTQIWGPDSEEGNAWGIDESWLINKVDCYIHIGNKQVHNKRILAYDHKEYQFPWLYSRGSIPEDNVIYVWGE